MTAVNQKSDVQLIRPDRRQGLFRAVLAGPGRTLAEAFANLEHAAGVQQLTRHGKRNLRGARIALTAEEGQGYWELTQIGEDVYVIVENFAYRDPRVEVIPGDGLIQFYFQLSGDLTVGVSRTEPLRLNRPSLLVYSQPLGTQIKEWTAPSARERSIAVTFTAKFLIENFLTSIATAPPQLQALIAGAAAKIQYFQVPLSAQIFDVATRLVDNPYNGPLALMYTEALTVELLCHTVAGFNALCHTEQFSEHDVRCLHAARELLMKQFAPAPTIHQVARMVGMNETSLKRGFRTVFGETPFDLSLRCRMEYALTLLREKRIPVGRVAEAVGYRHQTSFATAFRRHFGLCPRGVRPLRVSVRNTVGTKLRSNEAVGGAHEPFEE